MIGAIRSPSTCVPTIRVLLMLVPSLLVASLVVAVLLPVPAVQAQETDDSAPVVLVSPQTVNLGGTVEVTGSGWQPGSLVVADICGNEAARGSLDCIGATSERGVDGDGRFSLSLTVLRPPSPCPCVVVVTGAGGPQPVAVPLEIQGHPEAPVQEIDEADSPAGHLVVDEARLEGSGPWPAWFGASPSRTLVLTVRNTGDDAADLRLTVTAGPGDNPEGWVPVPDPGRLEAGERRTLRVPVDFDPLGFGRHTVAGEIEGVGSTASFATSTNIHPLGLYGVGAAILILAGAMFAVRRRSRSSAPPPAEASSPPEPSWGPSSTPAPPAAPSSPATPFSPPAAPSSTPAKDVGAET
jgi:hypothetical protein